MRFQCSSASRKFLTSATGTSRITAINRFSALQRAENSSPRQVLPRYAPSSEFQCSSASRKFLTRSRATHAPTPTAVSVLFSEPKIPHQESAFRIVTSNCVSVLFSEPKIPHLPKPLGLAAAYTEVSVLFSEPKIPHPADDRKAGEYSIRFSALQRAENSSPCARPEAAGTFQAFQCSSASRKFLTGAALTVIPPTLTGFSALQRAENSSPRTTAFNFVKN